MFIDEEGDLALIWYGASLDTNLRIVWIHTFNIAFSNDCVSYYWHAHICKLNLILKCRRHHKNSHRPNMQAIGPYKLMKVEGQDGTWFDTLTAWYKYGHSALLAAHFGSTVTKLVSICCMQR